MPCIGIGGDEPAGLVHERPQEEDGDFDNGETCPKGGRVLTVRGPEHADPAISLAPPSARSHALCTRAAG